MINGTAGTAFILMGPSGNGKSTLAKGVESHSIEGEGPYTFERVNVWTDRSSRGPQDDDYHFVSPAEFDRAAASGKFEFQTGNFGNRYGTELYKPANETTFPMYILSHKFAFGSLIRNKFAHTRTVFIDRYPVDYEKILRERDPLITDEDLSVRLGSIGMEHCIGDEYADIVFNNTGPVNEAAERLYRLLACEVS